MMRAALFYFRRSEEAISQEGYTDLYWFVPLTNKDYCGRVLPSIESAKASHAQHPDIPLRSDTETLRLIASIPLIQRREKHHSREEKSTFP